MTHRTYRRLDESSLQLGPLSLPQWLGLLLLAGLALALKQLTGIGIQATLSIGTIAVGAPAATMALSESGRPSYMRLARDAAHWTVHRKLHLPGGGTPHPLTLTPLAAPQPTDKAGDIQLEEVAA